MSSTTETETFGRSVTIDEAVEYYYDLLDIATWFDGDVEETEYLETLVVDLSSQVDQIIESYRPFAPSDEEAIVPLREFDAVILQAADRLVTFDREVPPLGVPKFEEALEIITQLHSEYGYPTEAHRPDTAETPPSWC